MKKSLLILFVGIAGLSVAQIKDPIVDAIVKEANENSQLEKLAHELIDGIGPRLVGSPQMKQANDWAVKKYEEWKIPFEMNNGANGAVGNGEFLILTWFIHV